jgi:maleylacetoacetate isomerase/maleylpyruvate isomerase
MSDLVLYNYFRSSASYRVRIALNWKGLPYEYKVVHLLNNGGEQNTAQYRAINPAGEIPTLAHKGQFISQSMAILQYLDDVFPQQPLFPKDPYEKAKVIQFCEGINCAQPYQNLKTQQVLEKDFGFSADQKTRWVQYWAHRNLEGWEKMLETTAGTYCFGEKISAAEIFLIPQMFALSRFGVEATKYPHIARIQAHCLKLDAFEEAHPGRQIDTPAELRK